MPRTETIATIERLRTVRRNQFSSRSIPDEDFAAILEAAVCAANASNRQSYALIVVDKAIQGKLNWPGDRVVVFCVDFTRLARLADAIGVPCRFDHFQPFLTGVIDTALAAQTAVIAAKSLGIDSLITNDAFLKDRDAIYRELHLPERYCFPLVAVSFGYPKVEPPVKKGRLRGKGLIHHGVYEPLTEEEADAMIRRYDDEAEHLGLNPNWLVQGWSHYLTWFFAKWSPALETRENSADLLDALRAAGFLSEEGIDPDSDSDSDPDRATSAG